MEEGKEEEQEEQVGEGVKMKRRPVRGGEVRLDERREGGRREDEKGIGRYGKMLEEEEC